MGKQILVSPEVLRKSAQGLAAAKEELTYLIEALEQVQTALPGCWESPNTQRYMEIRHVFHAPFQIFFN